MKLEVTERIIARAGLCKEEARVIRVLRELPSAGERTKRWVRNLSMRKYDQLLRSAEGKIQKATTAKKG